MERIKEAAYKLLDSDTVYTGHNHAKVRDKMIKDGVQPPIDNKAEDGFVTEEGRFVNRLDAADIAIKSGQIKKLDHPPELYSEDLHDIHKE